MGLQFVLLCFCIGLASGAKPQSGGSVDSAIENVDLHYSDPMCLQILMVDCSNHVTQGDEKICGTDGTTYANHCLFAHAACEFAYSLVHLGVQNHGPCPPPTTTTMATTTAAPVVTTAAPITAAPTTAAPAVTTTAPTSGAPTTQAATTATASATTVQPPATKPTTQVPTTTMLPTTTTTVVTGPTTTDATNGIVHGVFCMNADLISCDGSGVNVVCASNGQLYANQCEFAKAQCKNLSLTHATDPTTCVSG